MRMGSLYDRAGKDEVLARIAKLSPNAKPLWGKMDAAQMLGHCAAPIRVAFGELELKRSLLGVLFGRIAKNMMLSGKDVKRNLPTDKAFLVAAGRDLEPARRDLVQCIERFSADGNAGKIGGPHPFFGHMNAREWDVITWKHVDHHLRQFGV